MNEHLRTGNYIPIITPPGGFASAPETIEMAVVEQRIHKLAQLRYDMQNAIIAIQALEHDASVKRLEYEKQKCHLSEIQTDVQAAQKILNIPEESVARLIQRAGKRNWIRGMVEGFVSGVLSSYFVWWLTK